MKYLTGFNLDRYLIIILRMVRYQRSRYKLLALVSGNHIIF